MKCETPLLMPTGERLDLGLAIFTPVAALPGSPSLFVFQPLFHGTVVSSAGVLIVLEVILLVANRLCGLEQASVKTSDGQIFQMSVYELQEFLRTIACSGSPTSESAKSLGGIQTDSTSQLSSPGQPMVQAGTAPRPDRTALEEHEIGFLTGETREAPVVIGLAAAADYSNLPFAPGVFLLLPLLTLPGVRGALPMLILETLATILVRAVAPPQSTGIKPLTANPGRSRLIQFSPEDLLGFLSKFGRHFGIK